MIAFLRRLFGLDKPASYTPPASSPLPPKPRVSKPAPASLNHDYLEQLRIFGGITRTARHQDRIADLVDWKYLVEDGKNGYKLTPKGQAALGTAAWSPIPDRHLDR